MGVSLNGGTPISHPKMIIFSRKTPLVVGYQQTRMVVGCQHFRNRPIYLQCFVYIPMLSNLFWIIVDFQLTKRFGRQLLEASLMMETQPQLWPLLLVVGLVVLQVRSSYQLQQPPGDGCLQLVNHGDLYHINRFRFAGWLKHQLQYVHQQYPRTWGLKDESFLKKEYHIIWISKFRDPITSKPSGWWFQIFLIFIPI